MVGIVIASHGELALGIKQSASMIFGEQENVEAVTFMPHEGPEDLQKKLRQAVEAVGNDEVLFLVDLWGGSPFNQANILFEEATEQRAIVAGLNLPMVIEAYASRFSMDKAHAIAKAIMPTAIEAVKVRPEALQESIAPQAAAPATSASSQAIPEGTILGDGKLKIVLARIDTRLLHGQVATGWTKETKPDRIIVVSDEVAKDELRKKLIQQAAPPGVTAHVIPIKKLVEVSKDTRFGLTRAMLLFETPQEALEAVEQGVEIPQINIGSMAHSTGKVYVNSALSMSQEDVDALVKLRDKGVVFDVRKVPNDKNLDLFKLIASKANDGLSINK